MDHRGQFQSNGNLVDKSSTCGRIWEEKKNWLKKP
jgi:hypothetical protein